MLDLISQPFFVQLVLDASGQGSGFQPSLSNCEMGLIVFNHDSVSVKVYNQITIIKY